MKRSLLAKILTLLIFCNLIVLFISYHSGLLDSYFSKGYHVIQSSTNGGAIPSADSIKENYTDSISTRSKSYLKKIEEAKKIAKKDSLKNLRSKPNEKQLRLLSSSKSIRILDPQKMPFRLDSLLLDSIFSEKY